MRVEPIRPPERAGTRGGGPDCDNGRSYDLFVNDLHTVAAHVEGSNAVAVLKGGNGTGVPAFLPGGPQADWVVNCDTGIPGFTAIVLFTPANGH